MALSQSSPSELIVFADAVYRRTGACDGCQSKAVAAACCRYVMLPDRGLNRDESHWLSLHGLDQSAPRNIRIEQACSGLLPDGSCDLFGMPARPQMCINYPELPGLDSGCSYTFSLVSGSGAAVMPR